MGKFGSPDIALIVILLAALSILILAAYKLVRSNISSWNKVVWILTFILLNVIASVIFILYHDYILEPTKRAPYNTKSTMN